MRFNAIISPYPLPPGAMVLYLLLLASPASDSSGLAEEDARILEDVFKEWHWAAGEAKQAARPEPVRATEQKGHDML